MTGETVRACLRTRAVMSDACVHGRVYCVGLRSLGNYCCVSAHEGEDFAEVWPRGGGGQAVWNQ